MEMTGMKDEVCYIHNSLEAGGTAHHEGSCGEAHSGVDQEAEGAGRKCGLTVLWFPREGMGEGRVSRFKIGWFE